MTVLKPHACEISDKKNLDINCGIFWNKKIYKADDRVFKPHVCENFEKKPLDKPWHEKTK